VRKGSTDIKILGHKNHTNTGKCKLHVHTLTSDQETDGQIA